MSKRMGSSADSDLLHEFVFESRKGGTSYYKQGSAKYDSPELVDRRLKLRDAPKLRTAAMQFWATLGKGLDDHMAHDEYIYVHRRITKALAPELTDEESKEAAKEDWDEDLNGEEIMCFEKCAGRL